MDAVQVWDEPRPVKLTIEDFLCLHEAGAFDAYSKTELIDGTVLAMNAQFSTHARTKSRFFRRLADAVDAVLPGYEAWAEVSTAIPPVDMPEPDMVVTCFEASSRAPVPVDTIRLIVEVSDTTKRYDLVTKARLYAAAGAGILGGGCRGGGGSPVLEARQWSLPEAAEGGVRRTGRSGHD